VVMLVSARALPGDASERSPRPVLAVVSNEISSRSIERPETGNSRLLVGHIKSHNSLGAPDSLRSNNEGSALLPKEAIRERPFK